jgi:transcriptional regulator with XRE-family HTH domain
MTSYGIRLAERRRALGITQAGLARIAGVDESTVWRWENGVRRVPAWIHVVLDTLEKEPGQMVTSLAWLAKMREGA